MLTVDRIDLFYGAAQALRSVSLKAETGRILTVLGRNGVGKSSLLRAIVGQHMIGRGLDPLERRGHDARCRAICGPRRASAMCRRAARSFRCSPCART